MLRALPMMSSAPETAQPLSEPLVFSAYPSSFCSDGSARCGEHAPIRLASSLAGGGGRGACAARGDNPYAEGCKYNDDHSDYRSGKRGPSVGVRPVLDLRPARKLNPIQGGQNFDREPPHGKEQQRRGDQSADCPPNCGKLTNRSIAAVSEDSRAFLHVHMIHEPPRRL